VQKYIGDAGKKAPELGMTAQLVTDELMRAI
jgi:hypothetical protein